LSAQFQFYKILLFVFGVIFCNLMVSIFITTFCSFKVAVSLRFHHGGAAQQRMWATALRAACEHLPGALLGLNHKSSEVDGAHNRLLAPVAATKHLLFAPLSIMKHQVNQHKEASGSSSKSSAGKQKAESGGAAAPAVSTMAGKLDAAAE
jgi:hypothetical protein